MVSRSSYTPFVYTPGLQHLVCAAQSKGHTRMGQVFTFSRGGVVEYCANQNATLGSLETSMLASWAQFP